ISIGSFLNLRAPPASSACEAALERSYTSDLVRCYAETMRVPVVIRHKELGLAVVAISELRDDIAKALQFLDPEVTTRPSSVGRVPIERLTRVEHRLTARIGDRDQGIQDRRVEAARERA